MVTHLTNKPEIHQSGSWRLRVTRTAKRQLPENAQSTRDLITNTYQYPMVPYLVGMAQLHHYQHFSDLFYLARKKFQKNFGDITAKALFLHLFSDFF